MQPTDATPPVTQQVPSKRLYVSNAQVWETAEKAVEKKDKRLPYKSLSGWVQALLKRDLRKRAAELKKMGVTVPAEIFEK